MNFQTSQYVKFLTKIEEAIYECLSNFRIISWWAIHLSVVKFTLLLKANLTAHFKARKVKRGTPPLNFADLRALKTSDRIFVFGAGPSINKISDLEWEHIKNFDSLGFNSLFFLEKLDFTFFLLKEWGGHDPLFPRWYNVLKKLTEDISKNSFLKNTTFLLQKGISATLSNRLLGAGLWPSTLPYAEYWVDRLSRFPKVGFQGGLTHRHGTLCSVISLAVQLGYKEIVLTGVDLTGRGYFWSPPEMSVNWNAKTGHLQYQLLDDFGKKSNEIHNTAINGVVDTVGKWREFLAANYGVNLYVYNAESLMTRVLPIYNQTVNS